MIRRNAQAPDGSACWVLISQVEHARVAAELARHWGADGFAPLVAEEEMLPAIEHHDDGWAEWEAAPNVDPQAGRPLAFTEMPLEESLAIWRRSIERCATIGPLAAWTVAGHFSALLRGSSMNAGLLAQTWLQEFDSRRTAWMTELNSSAADAPRNAARALAQLQMFDALSLWFCCADRSQPYTLGTPDGPDLTITPAPHCFTLSPWPLTAPIVHLAVGGEAIPLCAYANQRDLADAPRETLTLAFELTP